MQLLWLQSCKTTHSEAHLYTLNRLQETPYSDKQPANPLRPDLADTRPHIQHRTRVPAHQTGKTFSASVHLGLSSPAAVSRVRGTSGIPISTASSDTKALALIDGGVDHTSGDSKTQNDEGEQNGDDTDDSDGVLQGGQYRLSTGSCVFSSFM